MSNLGFNHVVLAGFVGGDPVCSGQDKKPFATISIATNKCYQVDGEEKTITHWHKCVFFGKLAEIVGTHIKKGSHILVSGELENASWKNKDGQAIQTSQINVNEFRFLDKKPVSSDAEIVEESVF
jgi:single-strand DNA-binding protein